MCALMADFERSALKRTNKREIFFRRDDMPLALAPEGQELRVIKVLTDDKTKKHLESLGITISSILVILARDGDNIICGIKDGRIVLDRTLAAKILVS